MRLDRSSTSALVSIAVVMLGAAVTLSACASKTQTQTQHDDDNDSGGRGGAPSPGTAAEGGTRGFAASPAGAGVGAGAGAGAPGVTGGVAGQGAADAAGNTAQSGSPDGSAAEGGSAAGSAAEGGSAGAAGTITCPASGMTAPQPKGSGIRETFTGTNGTFEDSCADGNLVEYSCELTTFQGPPGDPATFYLSTGKVIAKTIDCGGRCADGACSNICPAVGDTMTYLSVAEDGSASFEDTTSGWSYACEPNTGLVCMLVPKAGDVVEVTSVYLPTDCPALAFFSVGASDAQCAYVRCLPTAP